jgi:hypothetical protein
LQFAADDNERMEMLKTWAAEGRGYEHERDHRTRTARHQISSENAEVRHGAKDADLD